MDLAFPCKIAIGTAEQAGAFLHRAINEITNVLLKNSAVDLLTDYDQAYAAAGRLDGY